MSDQSRKKPDAGTGKQAGERVLRERLIYGPREYRDAEGRLVDRYGQLINDPAGQRGAGNAVQAGDGRRGRTGVPLAHLAVMLVLVTLAFIGWVFRAGL